MSVPLKLLREAQALIRDILRTAASHNWNLPSVEGTLSTDTSRSEAETNLMRSKIETLKLYARWLGPYLRQARQLEQNARSDAGLVSVFNTAAIEVTLLARKEYPVEEDVDQGILPKLVLKTSRRCNAILVIELKIRAAPERTAGGAYGYRGRIEVVLISYALNEQELAVIRGEIERDALREVIGVVAGDAAGALSEIVDEIERLVPGSPKEEPKPEDTNPFTALFDFKKAKATNAADGQRDSTSSSPRRIRTDSEIEAVIRSQAILEARRRCLDFYGRCKQALKMACR